MHLNEGRLRAYYDHELSEAEQAQVSTHLAGCAACQKEAQQVQARAQRMQGYFASLPIASEVTPSASHARVLLQDRLLESQKESTTMWQLLQRYKTAWAGLTAILLFMVAMTFPSVQALANDVLGLFRVQQITVLEFDPNNQQEFDSEALQALPVLSDNVQTEAIGERQEVSNAAEASSAAGIPVRLPTAVDTDPSLVVEAGANVTLELDVERMDALLAAIGQENIDLPASLDGATVNANFPQAVNARYGEQCEDEEMGEGRPHFGEDGKKFHELSQEERRERREKMRRHFEERDCTVFMQIASPTVEAPDELPVEQLGSAFLQVVTGMSADDANEMSASIDWFTTFMLPIPTGHAEHSSISVDGTEGTLIQEVDRENGHYMLIWINNDIVYAINGNGDASTAVEMANSLQ